MFKLRKPLAKEDAAAASKKKKAGGAKAAAKRKPAARGKAPSKPSAPLRKRKPGPRIDLGVGPIDIAPAPGLSQRNSLAAAEAAIDKKATDVVVLDVRTLSGLCDEMLIATARSAPHLQAVSDAVEEAMRKRGEHVLHRDGLRGTEPDWVLLDYGDLLIHLFRAEARENYQLESYYSKARVLARWKND